MARWALTGMTLNVGVMGAGWVARARHIPAFRAHPHVRVAALFDRSPERASRAAHEEGIPRFTSSLSEFLDLGLDIVSICTPPWTHGELAGAALGHGSHVFTEKPMAMNGGEADAMVQAARSAERLLCVSHNFLFSRAVRRADRVLEGERPVRHALALQLSSLNRRLPMWHTDLPGGLLLDESPHMIYTLQHFLGPLELEGVRADWGDDPRLPRAVEIRVRSPSGLGQVMMVFDTPISEWHVALVGRDHCVDLDLFRDIAVAVGTDGAHQPRDILRTSSKAVLGHVRGFVGSGTRYVGRRLLFGHDVLIARFVDAVIGGGPPPVSTEEALGVVRLTDAVLAELAVPRGQP